jgi:hypothetical protein
MAIEIVEGMINAEGNIFPNPTNIKAGNTKIKYDVGDLKNCFERVKKYCINYLYISLIIYSKALKNTLF